MSRPDAQQCTDSRHSFGPGKVLLGVRLDFKSFYGGFIIIILHALVAALTKSLWSGKKRSA